MLRSQKPWVLLAGLAAVGALLTAAQAKEQYGAAASRAGSVFYGNDGAASGELQQELHAQWQKDVAAAGGRAGVPLSPRTAGRIRASNDVDGRR